MSEPADKEELPPELGDLLDVYERCGFRDLARSAIESRFAALESENERLKETANESPLIFVLDVIDRMKAAGYGRALCGRLYDEAKEVEKLRSATSEETS